MSKKKRKDRFLNSNNVSLDESYVDASVQESGLGLDDWILFIMILLTILVMPFLYTRLTTENFLTPKEFFSNISIVILAGACFFKAMTGQNYFVTVISAIGIVLSLVFLRSPIAEPGQLPPGNFFNIARYFLLFIAFIYCCWAVLFLASSRPLPKGLRKTSLDFPLLLFFGFAILSVVWNYNPESAIRDLRGTFSVLMLFFLITHVIKRRWQLETVLWVVIIAALATSSIGIMERFNIYFKVDPNSGYSISYATGEILQGRIDPKAYYLPLFPQLARPDRHRGSVVSTFGNRNYLGTFAMFAAFLPLGLFFYYDNIFMKAFSMLVFALLLGGLFVTDCRAALVGILLGLIYMVFMLRLYDRKNHLLYSNMPVFIVAVLFVLIGVTVFTVYGLRAIGSESIADKINDTLTLDRSRSNTYERLWVWYATNYAFLSPPSRLLIGQGFGSFKHFFPRLQANVFSRSNQETFTAVTFRQAHNDWLQLLAELGVIGVGLFLFILSRFFGSISKMLTRTIYLKKDGVLNGEHVLLISISSAMVAQLLASVPDFPLHRIETAFYAVLFMSLVPLIVETNFFKRPLPESESVMLRGFDPILKKVFIAGVVVFAGVSSCLAAHQNLQSWRADQLVRYSDQLLRQLTNVSDHNVLENMLRHINIYLTKAIELDPLPGDPYLKLATVNEHSGNVGRAIELANQAKKNINFNARSTYHSVFFRKMIIYYQRKKDLASAWEMAMKGLDYTCGTARSVYYIYGGRIALDISRQPIPEEKKKEMHGHAMALLTRATEFDNLQMQAKATLAFEHARLGEWEKAGRYASVVSGQVSNRDPNMLNIAGISAYNLNDLDSAEKYLYSAHRLSPSNPAFMRDLAMVHFRKGRKQEALSLFQRIVKQRNVPDEIRKHAKSMLINLEQN